MPMGNPLRSPQAVLACRPCREDDSATWAKAPYAPGAHARADARANAWADAWADARNARTDAGPDGADEHATSRHAEHAARDAGNAAGHAVHAYGHAFHECSWHGAAHHGAEHHDGPQFSDAATHGQHGDDHAAAPHAGATDANGHAQAHGRRHPTAPRHAATDDCAAASLRLVRSLGLQPEKSWVEQLQRGSRPPCKTR